MHLVFHFGTLVCAILGLVFIVKYKWSSPGVFPFFTMYSAHSWAGVATLGLWTVQVVSSVTFRLAPVPKSLKDGFSDWHQYLGCCVFVSGLATCALGLQDMQSSDLAGSAMLMDGSCMSMPGYAPHSMLAMLASAAALMLIVVGMSTFAAMKFFQQPLFLAEPAEKLEPGPLQT